jgi:hypothetical protein
MELRQFSRETVVVEDAEERKRHIRSLTRFGGRIAISLLVLAIAPLSEPFAKTTQSTVTKGPSVDGAARPCKNIASGSKSSKGTTKRNRKKILDDADTAAACLEVRSTVIEIQEYLQNYGREEKWNLSGEHVAEDAWTFSRKLEKEELLGYTKKDANTDRVNWTSGVAFIQVKTLELNAGFVRVQVSARFQGYGQSLDRFAPPKESWPLSSNATLENQLISILEKHSKSTSNPPAPRNERCSFLNGHLQRG